MSEYNEEFSMHNDCISLFNNELFANVFTQENIVSKKKCITIAKDKFYGYFLEKNRESYFVLDEFVKDLPFRIVKSTETDYKTDVFKFVEKIEPINIPNKQELSIRKLVNNLGKFKHSNPKHWTINKICSVAAYCDRTNFRVSTEAGFGKDSCVNIIQHLVNSTVNLYGATFAKLEFVLMNKLIILNELGNLKKDDLANMQEFLLAVGAYFNTYTKRTRKTATTQEQYDISKLSLILFYNLPSYYTDKAQEFFDQMFTKAVANRFIPFVFEGRITTQFDKLVDSKAVMEANREVYKKIIASLNYYKNNPIIGHKYKIPKEISFHEDLMRYERSFSTILKYVAEYSESQEEFNDLSIELYKCYKQYGVLLGNTGEMK